MSFYLTTPFSIPVGKNNDAEYVANKLCRLLRVSKKDLLGFSLYKRSIDARNKADVRFVCSYVVNCAVSVQNATPYTEPQDAIESAQRVNTAERCIVVGSGPAGLFAALYLAKSGLVVTVVERGSDVLKRRQAVDEFFAGGRFSETTNVQFGLGGAGTFSDGKLTSNLGYTPLGRTVFNQFVRFGAPEEILYESLPHIGTDNLQKIVGNFRSEIEKYGGKFLFEHKAADLIVENGRVKGVAVKHGSDAENLYAEHVILACGNSARDTFEMLHNSGVDMRFKPFAVGLRIEHSRRFINSAQYGKLFASHRDLGAATYKLTHKCADGHGCYSFCMCPGGMVVAANSEAETVAVNGMSDFSRAAANSNSALVVTVNESDVERYGFGRDVFAGVNFQRGLESKAYALGGGDYIAPCQNASDFVENRVSSRFVTSPSYPRGVVSCNLRSLLPKDLGGNLAEALLAFDRKINGFLADGTLTGVETRTSSPVKILRDESFQSSLKGLYPVGEGAGYAGGIVSSAVDGLRAALLIVARVG